EVAGEADAAVGRRTGDGGAALTELAPWLADPAEEDAPPEREAGPGAVALEPREGVPLAVGLLALGRVDTLHAGRLERRRRAASALGAGGAQPHPGRVHVDHRRVAVGAVLRVPAPVAVLHPVHELDGPALREEEGGPVLVERNGLHVAHPD